jgi:membrane-associated phospholipid phosphatase
MVNVASSDFVIEVLESRRHLAGDIVIDWNNVALDAIRADLTPPPIAARNLAIVQLSVLDAVKAAKSRPARAAAAAQAAHDALVALYPAQAATSDLFDSGLASSLLGVADGPAKDNGEALGKQAAARELANRANDGANAVVPYTPGTGPQDWQPTPPAFAPALLPNWPAVKPFALKSGNQFRPAGPPAVDSAAFADAFNQVKALGAKTGSARTADQTQIAQFWADGGGTATPPGHWNQIAQVLAESHHDSLRADARLFALLDVALADAGIAAWDAKYAYNYVRPVTAIQNAATDGNPSTDANAAWAPLLVTPPFPSYVSGHSTFSGAAASVLAAFFRGDRQHLTITSEGLPGVTRSFKSLQAAAEEAGMSRIYGGIHYGFDNADGLKLGRQVGAYVMRHGP